MRKKGGGGGGGEKDGANRGQTAQGPGSFLEYGRRKHDTRPKGNRQEPDDAGEDEGGNHEAEQELFVTLVRLCGGHAQGLCL